METHLLNNLLSHARTLGKWFLIGIVCGLLCGGAGALVAHAVRFASSLRGTYEALLYALPLAGVLIVALYRLFGDQEDPGTNLVLQTISGKGQLPLRRVPEILLATFLSHLCGASVGRAGAAMQMGGSLAYNLGKKLRLDEDALHTVTMCGLSAAFSALFRTPLAAAFFAMEISEVGLLHYEALIPCVIASLTATLLSTAVHTTPDVFPVEVLPAINAHTIVMALLLAVLAAFVSILLCVMLHGYATLYRQFLKNPYLRAVVGGLLVVLLTVLSGTRLYNGGGIDAVALAMAGSLPPLAFIWKLLFTGLSIGAGFKGGEIAPTLFIGAAFGAAFSRITSFDPALSVAIGIAALFAGVTNCPLTALLFSFELFGGKGMPFFLLAVAISYPLSGYFSLYSGGQEIARDKYPH